MNPPRGEVFGRCVEAIYYRHAEDGKPYVHEFAHRGRDVRMVGLPDGSIHIKSARRGVRLWKEF